jgi:hypothetical protein
MRRSPPAQGPERELSETLKMWLHGKPFNCIASNWPAPGNDSSIMHYGNIPTTGP